MITFRRSKDRGHFQHGWLETYHTFSFGEYYDPHWTTFGSLRVMNEDFVAPGQGFDTHSHRDMEIVTYVLSGALEHKDSLGNGEVLRPGEFQRMSAGTGIRHSEFNPSTDQLVHLYQIWLLPREKGLPPGYEQKPIDLEASRNQFLLVASPDGEAGSLTIQQNARIFLSKVDAGQTVSATFSQGRKLWIQVLEGEVTFLRQNLGPGDAVALSQETFVTLQAQTAAQVMLFDMDDAQ